MTTIRSFDKSGDDYSEIIETYSDKSDDSSEVIREIIAEPHEDDIKYDLQKTGDLESYSGDDNSGESVENVEVIDIEDAENVENVENVEDVDVDVDEDVDVVKYLRHKKRLEKITSMWINAKNDITKPRRKPVNQKCKKSTKVSREELINQINNVLRGNSTTINTRNYSSQMNEEDQLCGDTVANLDQNSNTKLGPNGKVCCSAIRGSDNKPCKNLPRCFVDGKIYCKLHAQWRLKRLPVSLDRNTLMRLVTNSDYTLAYYKLSFTKVDISFIANKYYSFKYDLKVNSNIISFKMFWYFCESCKLFLGDIINGKVSEAYINRVAKNSLINKYEESEPKEVIGYYWPKESKMISKTEFKRNICKLVNNFCKKSGKLKSLKNSIIKRINQNKSMTIPSHDSRHICDVLMDDNDYINHKQITYSRLMDYHFKQTDFTINMILLSIALIKNPSEYPWLK